MIGSTFRVNSRAQLSLEFIYAIGAALVISIVLLVAVGKQIEGLGREKERFVLQDKATELRKEILIAAEVQDGYSRTFVLPYNLSGVEYNASISGSSLVLQSSNNEFVLKVPGVNGNLVKGKNTIRRVGGVLYLN